MVEIKDLGRFLITVQKPDFKPSLNKKLMWTGLVLVIYFMLSSQLFGSVYGVAPGIIPQFQLLQTITGSSFGTLMTLGIGPLVTSSILLQLLVGSKIINWDLKESKDKQKYEIVQKIIAVALCFLEAAGFVLGGTVPPVNRQAFTVSIVIFQLALGGMLAMLLDEVVTKYGIGSGISLFIAAGVINTIFVGFFSPCAQGAGCSLPAPGERPVGNIWAALIYLVNGKFGEMIMPLIPIFATVFVFVIIIYAQGISVDIPLSFATVRGFSRRWSLKLFYTSNIPVILTAALIANMQLIATLVSQPTDDPSVRCGFLGCFTQSGATSVPTSGFIYYFSTPSKIILEVISGTFTPQVFLRTITYLSFMVASAVIFSIFWVATSGMDSESVAKQITSAGMQIPGYRNDPRIIKSVLEKYIPSLTILGGAAIGFLAAFADFTDAIGTGTGILLTVTILYGFYETLLREKTEGAHPLVRKFLEEE